MSHALQKQSGRQCTARQSPFGQARRPVFGQIRTRAKKRVILVQGTGRTPDALLFDCDGVLVDTERDGHRIAFNEAFTRKGTVMHL